MIFFGGGIVQQKSRNHFKVPWCVSFFRQVSKVLMTSTSWLQMDPSQATCNDDLSTNILRYPNQPTPLED